MDEELDGLRPPTPDGAQRPKGRKSKRQREAEERLPGRLPPSQLEDQHRKFMMVMFGLFLVILLLMLFFNQHMDFAVDGGI